MKNPVRPGRMPWLALSLASAFGLGLIPAVAGAQNSDAPAKPIAVVLDLYSGDKLSQGFSDALTAAVSGDDRFEVVKALPADGMKIVMKDALLPQNNDSETIAAYDVLLTLGNGKYLDEKQGFCDVAKLTMCGRVVAQDSFDAYQAYLAHHKPR